MIMIVINLLRRKSNIFYLKV